MPPLDLSAREISLLEILLQRPGRLVNKEQLVDRLCEWGEEVSTTRSRFMCTACARNSSRAESASRPCAAWVYCLERIELATDSLQHAKRRRRRLSGALLRALNRDA